MKRASYREGVQWIAQNDDPETMDVETISRMISVALLADLFDKEQFEVACAIANTRSRLRIENFIKQQEVDN